MEYTLASALAAFGIVSGRHLKQPLRGTWLGTDAHYPSQLSRGNAYVNLLSIGLPTPLVPPLPGNIDGPQALGLATHGRFEGETSTLTSRPIFANCYWGS